VYRGVIKILSYFCSLLAKIRISRLIVTKILDTKFYQINLAVAAVFWEDRSNNNRAITSISYWVWERIYK